MKIIKKVLGCLILFFLIAASPASVWAQGTAPVKYSGTITDEKGEPVIGASILIKGTSVGTITDIDGKYVIEAAPGSTLQISYIGYLSAEIQVSNQRSVNLVLEEDAKTLDEVVVIGYGVQKKRDLTGAVSSIKMDDAPVATFSTVSHALAGKAAGLQALQTSAQPGGGAKFRIRGATSINAGNDPLIIIDGFPVTSNPDPK